MVSVRESDGRIEEVKIFHNLRIVKFKYTIERYLSLLSNKLDLRELLWKPYIQQLLLKK